MDKEEAKRIFDEKVKPHKEALERARDDKIFARQALRVAEQRVKDAYENYKNTARDARREYYELIGEVG